MVMQGAGERSQTGSGPPSFRTTNRVVPEEPLGDGSHSSPAGGEGLSSLAATFHPADSSLFADWSVSGSFSRTDLNAGD